MTLKREDAVPASPSFLIAIHFGWDKVNGTGQGLISDVIMIISCSNRADNGKAKGLSQWVSSLRETSSSDYNEGGQVSRQGLREERGMGQDKAFGLRQFTHGLQERREADESDKGSDVNNRALLATNRDTNV